MSFNKGKRLCNLRIIIIGNIMLVSKSLKGNENGMLDALIICC